MIGTTITQFIMEEQRKYPSATGDLTLVIRDLVTACKAVALAMRYGGLSDGDLFGVSSNENVHGESQKTLDLLANDLFVQHAAFAGHVAGMVSEELESPWLPDVESRGRYLLLYDPVDGSSNIAENASIGSIFSILRRPNTATGHPKLDEFLQPGANQVCAGYAIYGPSCMLVITTGNGVNGFTLDPGLGEFLLTHPQMTIPQDGSRFCVNMTHRDRWERGIVNYINDRGGQSELRSPGFDLRWSGCAVADVHRILLSGGIYLSPVVESETDLNAGKLRLLYEANPLGMLAEQAGGVTTDGKRRVLDIKPESIHQELPFILGSKHEVDLLLTRYLNQAGD